MGSSSNPNPNPNPDPNLIPTHNSLLQGSPYVTMLYDGSLTPMVTSVLIGSATEVDGKKVRPRLPT